MPEASTGPLNVNVTVCDSPAPLQVAVAPAMVMAEGPVITKSEPLAASVLQRNASGNCMVIEEGVQLPGAFAVPIGNGVCAATVKEVDSPAFILLLQAPSKVLPSEPVAIVIW